MLMKGELYKAPITNPQKILDLGTGTGIWALDIAEYATKPPSSMLIASLTLDIGNSQQQK